MFIKNVKNLQLSKNVNEACLESGRLKTRLVFQDKSGRVRLPQTALGSVFHQLRLPTASVPCTFSLISCIKKTCHQRNS